VKDVSVRIESGANVVPCLLILFRAAGISAIILANSKERHELIIILRLSLIYEAHFQGCSPRNINKHPAGNFPIIPTITEMPVIDNPYSMYNHRCSLFVIVILLGRQQRILKKL
jgi:hypothetical protein